MNPGLSPEARAPYSARFAELVANRGPSWLVSTREEAFRKFVAQGWPTKKQEEWRFTDVSPMTEEYLLPAPARGAADLSSFPPVLLKLGHGSGHRLVFVDGRYAPELGSTASSAGLQVGSIASALDNAELGSRFGRHLQSRNAFVALNTAFMTDGAFVQIPAGLHVEAPIYLVYLASAEGSTSFPRTLIVAAPGSRATVVEVYLGASGRATLSNAATEIVLGTDARLAYQSIQQTSELGFHIGHVAVSQDSGSELSAHSLSLDGRIVRNDIQTVLAGEGCTTRLGGVYLASGKSHIDNQTTIDHDRPRCTSREDYRGVVDGAGHAVFSGRIIVRPGAEKTDAQQTNRNLLLSDSAQVNSKPQLEIFTSDVKCSHGATTGRLDPDALFYLRARGIGKSEADRILIRAFLHQGLEQVSSEELRSELEELLDRRIDKLVAGEAGR
jgi:Fe-S cluster assembly protein SufD